MLTHTGRTYAPGSVLPRRCEAECAAVAVWAWHERKDEHGRCDVLDRLCSHHARLLHPGSYYYQRSKRRTA